MTLNFRRHLPTVALFASLAFLLIALMLFGLRLAFNAYTTLPDAKRNTLNGVVCLAIDAGLHEAKRRSDAWGKAAKWVRLYLRFVRKYPS